MQNNVPVTDQRNFTALMDEKFIEVLGRAPAGTESAFAAVQAWIKHWATTADRLGEAYKTWDGKSPTIRFKKDSYEYFLRVAGVEEKRTANVYTVLNAVQLPVYVKRIKEGCLAMVEWIARMDRRLIGQDGKSREELVTAFQNSQGRQLPSEMAGQTIIQLPGQTPQKGPRRGIFAPLKPPGK